MTAQQKTDSENPHFIPTLGGRVDALATLSLIPCLICIVAFTRSLLFRLFGIGGYFVGLSDMGGYTAENQCKNFGWLENGSFKVTCDHRPMDIHAILALGWLFLFTLQILCIKFNFRGFHKTVGKYGMPIAFLNVAGMIILSIADLVNPIEGNVRPATFTPFMWLLAFWLFYAVKKSYDAIQEHQIDAHALWMYRGFMLSFSTPIIRFYPLVLRYIFGTECSQLNRPRKVVGSMFVAMTAMLVLFWRGNQKVTKKPMDGFLKFYLCVYVLGFLAELASARKKGFFFYGMYQCWKVGPDNYESATA